MERTHHPVLRFSVYFLIVIYAVGLLGLSFRFFQPVFEKLVPWNLLLSVCFLLLFHRPYSLKAILFFSILIAAGWFVEWLGVHSQLVFGTYQYLSSLGWRISEVPVVIGFNWLLLTYVSADIVKRFEINSPWLELSAAVVMVLIDALIEPLAAKLNFWQWQPPLIPSKNYIAWFYISFIFQFIFNRFIPHKLNPLALPLFLLILGFFLLLNIEQSLFNIL